jgi:hypothetical protein
VARKAKYTKALPVYVTPAVRARLDEIAEIKDLSVAEVTRRLIDEGLGSPRLEQIFTD